MNIWWTSKLLVWFIIKAIVTICWYEKIQRKQHNIFQIFRSLQSIYLFYLLLYHLGICRVITCIVINIIIFFIWCFKKLFINIILIKKRNIHKISFLRNDSSIKKSLFSKVDKSNSLSTLFFRIIKKICCYWKKSPIKNTFIKCRYE